SVSGLGPSEAQGLVRSHRSTCPHAGPGYNTRAATVPKRTLPYTFQSTINPNGMHNNLT
ncbi:hypothetical protein AVEN_31849-2-1, partial [Araneus ventricosus]